MDEGVDPTKMCSSLVEKVIQSKQLRAVFHPEVLELFEAWLEELEDEVITRSKANGADPAALSQETGIPLSGIAFILAKLAREGRL